MMWLKDFVGVLGFKAASVRSLAERRAYWKGLACFVAGLLAYVGVRNLVYEVLLPQRSFLSKAFFVFSLTQVGLLLLFFLLFAYIPSIILWANTISDDGIGFSFSKEEYLSHLSVLLPLWGAIFLVTAPLQWLIPHFLITEVIEISVGALVLTLLLFVYTLWAIKELNYLSFAKACGVFALSFLALPVYFFAMSLLFPLPFLIILIYFGVNGFRRWNISHFGTRDFQRNLQALTINPQDADAHYQQGVIHLNRRNTDAALGYFETAVKITPQVAEYHYYLGRACELKGNWPKAMEHYEETYRLDPEYGQGDIFREVGKAYLNTGNVEKGKEFLDFFLSRRDADPEGRYWLAIALQKSGDVEQSRFQLNRIIEQARVNPRFFRKRNREWIYRARKQLREGKIA